MAALTAFIGVRSYWLSDWVRWVHRSDRDVGHVVGTATRCGVGAFYITRGTDWYFDSMIRDDVVHYDAQPLDDVSNKPLAQPTHRLAGFGYTWRHLPAMSVAGDWEWYLQINVPLWFVVIITVAPGLILVRQWWRVAHAVAEGRCTRCGYDLRATPGRCPECGEVVPARVGTMAISCGDGSG
jgi:hypothetical protein